MLPDMARSQVRVMSPEWLVRQFGDTRGRIEGSTATFGAPFYGERILGQVVWGDSRGQMHCTAEDYDVPRPEKVTVPGKDYTQVRLIHIVLVRRGTCSFVTKVSVARKKGAHAVIIVDKEDSTLTSSDIRRIIVADDGYGKTIDIPSLLVSKEDGEKLIRAANTSQVLVELAWDVPTNHVVVMDLWMSSASRESQRFLKEFAPKRKALNQAVKFVPHYHVFSMQSDYNDLCTDYTAKFCAEDPDGSGDVTGKDVLEEDVRQLCIHDLTKVKRTDWIGGARPDPTVLEYAEKWWDYVEMFADECPVDGSGDRKFGRTCAETVMRKVDIDVGKVQDCLISKKEEKLAQERENVAWSPRALRVNGWRYSGTLDADTVTRAICAGFVQQPQACAELVEPVNPFKNDLPPMPEEGVSFGTFFLGLLIVGCVLFGVVLLYKRSLTKHIHTALREEVMLEVQAQMDTYKQLPS